jgi:hypothetical protein
MRIEKSARMQQRWKREMRLSGTHILRVIHGRDALSRPFRAPKVLGGHVTRGVAPGYYISRLQREER